MMTKKTVLWGKPAKLNSDKQRSTLVYSEKPPTKPLQEGETTCDAQRASLKSGGFIKEYYS